MKKMLFSLFILLIMLPEAEACVGKTLNIGVTESVEGRVFAEILSTIVNERTGTTMNITYFDNTSDIYEAVKENSVDITVENTTRAMAVLNQPVVEDAREAYKIVKNAYEEEKGLIWLRPYGFSNGNEGGPPSYTATLLRMEVLSNYPALPRLFNKLGKTMNDTTYKRLIEAVRSGQEPGKVARNFLKSKKLI